MLEVVSVIFRLSDVKEMQAISTMFAAAPFTKRHIAESATWNKSVLNSTKKKR